MGIFSKYCKNTTNGDITLGFGLHEITITVGKRPCKVYFCIKDPCDGTCTCHGDINKLGITITDCGFILYADIKTNTCCIEWSCEF